MSAHEDSEEFSSVDLGFDFPDHYGTLAIHKNSGAGEIRQAYRARLLEASAIATT